MTAVPMSLNIFDFSRRDITCITIALAIHSLLLLWTATSIKLIEEDKNLGEAIVEVSFVTDAPGYDLGSGSKAPARKKKGLMSRVKKFFASKPKKAAPPKPDIAMGSNSKIKSQKPTWAKTKTDKLVGKDFKKMKSFSSVRKEDNVQMAKGQSNKVKVAKGNTSFQSNKPNLKSKDYRLSPSDTPFKIKKAKNVDSLSNVNAVAVNVGRKTSASVKAFSGNAGGASLKGKSFSKGKSGGSFGSPSGTSKGDGLIAMGSSNKINSKLATGSGLSSSSSGSRSSSSGRKGRSARTSAGTSFSGATSIASLPRNTVSGGGDAVSSGGKKPFEIRGALSGRSILNNPLPKIQDDIRATFKFYVDWAGRVLDGIVTLAGSGNPTIDRKLREALSKWIFEKLPKSRASEVQEGVITFKFIGR